MIRIGVDTGGTFTDLVRLDENGLSVHKVRSTPGDPARAILAGLAELTAGQTVQEVVHGSTVATNAVLERKGARVALITTAGFEDVLAIGRQTRSRLYDFQVRAPEPMVDRSLVFGVKERIDFRGEVLLPLSEEEIDRVVHELSEAQVECVAICLLHSYVNSEHERRIADRLAAKGHAVSASHNILPEYREFERWSTTVVNAYVTPIMSQYLAHVEQALEGTRLHIMQSNGGAISAGQARSAAVRTILSGPAAGAVGAQVVAKSSGYDRAILFDMGGTSTDVSLMDRRVGLTAESVIGAYPVRLPMLDIHTVGAGGGSIAYVDSGGALRVGPRSAGADPGPVCYGKGDEFTVSDANLLLGRLPADHFLDGRMRLDAGRTQHRAELFAAGLSMTVDRLCEGIVQIANTNMEHAIRAISVQRGYDPREFALLAFGGGGGMHACEIAESMEIDTVLVPRYAGVLSALGMLLADVRKDYSMTILEPSASISLEQLHEEFGPLLQRACDELAAEGFEAGDLALERLLDVRYQGQSYEIGVPLDDDFEAEFHRRHERLYGYASTSRPTEIVNIRVNAAGITRKYKLPSVSATSLELPEPLKISPARFGGEWVDTPMHDRGMLSPGMHAAGPAILCGGDATVVIPPSFSFRLDGTGTLIAKRNAVPTIPDRTFLAAAAGRW